MKFCKGDIVQDKHGNQFLMVGNKGEMKPIGTAGGDGYEDFRLVASTFREAEPEFEIEVPEDLLNDTFPEDIKELLLDPAIKRGLIQVVDAKRVMDGFNRKKRA